MNRLTLSLSFFSLQSAKGALRGANVDNNHNRRELPTTTGSILDLLNDPNAGVQPAAEIDAQDSTMGSEVISSQQEPQCVSVTVSCGTFGAGVIALVELEAGFEYVIENTPEDESQFIELLEGDVTTLSAEEVLEDAEFLAGASRLSGNDGMIRFYYVAEESTSISLYSRSTNLACPLDEEAATFVASVCITPVDDGNAVDDGSPLPMESAMTTMTPTNAPTFPTTTTTPSSSRSEAPSISPSGTTQQQSNCISMTVQCHQFGEGFPSFVTTLELDPRFEYRFETTLDNEANQILIYEGGVSTNTQLDFLTQRSVASGRLGSDHIIRLFFEPQNFGMFSIVALADQDHCADGSFVTSICIWEGGSFDD